MTRTSPPQLAFSSGELDPLLHRRSDYQRFQTGLAKCVGYLPLAQGAFTRAPGTIYRGRTKNDARAVLVPFQFAANDALVLEFTPNVMRVWRYGELVMSGGVPYELATPYDEPSLSSLKWVQSADVIYLCDGINPVQRLARLALDSWTIGDQAYTKGPFRVQNLDKTLTLQASASTGTINLTASADFFVSAQVGMLIMIQATDNKNVPYWRAGEGQISVGDRRRYGRNMYQLMTKGDDNVGGTPPIHDEGTVSAERGSVWKFLSDDTGIVRVTSITSPTVAVCTVLKAIPLGCIDDPTYRWSEGAWNERYGYPSALEIYDQRLAAAATPTEPRSVWFSAVGDFADFEPGTEADESFAYSLAGNGSVNRILNLRRGGSGLHIFALGEEASTRSDTGAQAIGPTNVKFGVDGGVGSSPALPIVPAGNPIFISRDRRRVLEVIYSLEDDRNITKILSRTAQHIGASLFEQIVWQSAPEPTAWLRLGTGELVAMLYDQGEEVLGWAPIPVAGGFVDGLAVTADVEGSTDVLMMTVLREIDGETIRTVEEQAATFGVLTGAQPIAEACHLFCAQIFPEGGETFSVPHLVGETVYAWTSQGQYGPLVVSDTGEISTPIAVDYAIIGLFDESHYADTLDVQAAAQDGSTVGRSKRLQSGMGIGLHRTAQGYVEVVERNFAQAERVGRKISLVSRPVASDLTTAFSGVSKIEAPSGQAQELALRFRPAGGAPMTIAAIVPIVQEAGR